MARIRTIKPEFWQDEDLAEVSEPALILAAALLNHADDEGYFRAHPGLIRAACFPLREPSLTIHGMLSELSNIGYIAVFEGSDGKEYGKIVNFAKHQRVNRPTPSRIRELEEFTESSLSPHPRKGKEQGKERKGKELSRPKGLEGKCPEDDLPDDNQQENQEQKTKPDRVPVQQVVDLYHKALPELPAVQKLTDTRRGYIQQRWREDLPDLDHWQNFFAHVRRSDFLMGKTAGSQGKPPFRADLEWLTKPANFAKIAEDKYHTRSLRAVP